MDQSRITNGSQSQGVVPGSWRTLWSSKRKSQHGGQHAGDATLVDAELTGKAFGHARLRRYGRVEFAVAEDVGGMGEAAYER